MSAGASAIPTGDISGGMPGGGGGDLDLSSTLGSAFDEALSTESTPPAGEAPPSGETDLFAAEPVVDPAATPTDPNAQPGTEASPYQLSPDGKFYQVPKSELPQFQTAQKYFQQVSQHFPTAQDAAQALVQSSSHRMMSNDWRGGQPEGIETVLNHLAGFDHTGNPQVQQRYQQSFAKMAELMPNTLKQINPQAYEGMQNRLISETIESAYQKAAASGNPEDFKAAQERDYGFTGQYKTDLSQVQKQAQVSDQDRRIQQSEARYTQALNRDSKDFHVNGVEEPKFKQFGEMLDKTLGKIKDRYEPAAYQDIKANVHRELIDTMQGTAQGLSELARSENSAWWHEHKQEHAELIRDFQEIWKAGGNAAQLRPRVQSYQNSFVSRANRLLPQIAQKRIGAATNAAQARSRTGQFAAQPPQARQPGQAAAPQQTNGRTSSDQWNSDWAGEFAQFRS